MVSVEHGRVRWFVIAFIAAGFFMSSVLVWQLWDVTPARWCAIAQSGNNDIAAACLSILLKLLDLKNNVVIGLLAIVGLSVLSLAVVALGVRINAAGPGGLTANIGSDKTIISDADGVSSVEIPTPPAEKDA